MPRQSGHYNVSMKFNQNYVILADGTGFLYVISTGDRSGCTLWKVCIVSSYLKRFLCRSLILVFLNCCR